MSEVLRQGEMLKAKFEGSENAEPLQEKEHKQLDADGEEKIDPHARVSKWPKGKSPEGRTKGFVEKHGGKISRRPPRHSGKGYEGRDSNFKYWVPDREKAERETDQRKIEEALVEKMDENSGNPHEADWSPAEWEAVFHALDESDWKTALLEVNDEIDTERKRLHGVQKRTDSEKQAPYAWDTKQLRKEAIQARKERYFGRDRLN